MRSCDAARPANEEQLMPYCGIRKYIAPECEERLLVGSAAIDAISERPDKEPPG